MKMMTAAACLVFASTGTFAQTATLQNGGFEVTCLFCGGPFAEGWHSPGGNVLARQRTVGDGLTPAFSPVGTPNALTPHTGSGVQSLSTSGNGGFVGVTTDTVNFCYCDQTCQTQCNGPYPFFDPVFDYTAGDVVVTAWYMVPLNNPITDQSFIKVDIKVGNQNVATFDAGAVPTVTGNTNGEWRQYTAVIPKTEIVAQYECNTGVRPDCGCSCVPLSPSPNHAKITIGRFVGDGEPSSGTIYWDDVTYMQLPAAPTCGTADFDGDGDTGTDADIEAFFACLAGNCCATCFPGGSDFNQDGDAGTDADIEAFFRVLAGGNC